MICQHRTYQVRPGVMDEFVALFRDHLVPLREAYGYQVLGAWNDADSGTFVWVVGHEAPDGWDAAEKAYYDAPERAELPANPSDYLESSQTQLLQPVL
jgi:hypothetical protein